MRISIQVDAVIYLRTQRDDSLSEPDSLRSLLKLDRKSRCFVSDDQSKRMMELSLYFRILPDTRGIRLLDPARAVAFLAKSIECLRG